MRKSYPSDIIPEQFEPIENRRRFNLSKEEDATPKIQPV